MEDRNVVGGRYLPPFVMAIAFGPNGDQLARSGPQMAALEVKAPKVNAVVFRPDGSWLAVGGDDFLRSSEVRVWKVNDILKESFE